MSASLFNSPPAFRLIVGVYFRETVENWEQEGIGMEKRGVSLCIHDKYPLAVPARAMANPWLSNPTAAPRPRAITRLACWKNGRANPRPGRSQTGRIHFSL